MSDAVMKYTPSDIEQMADTVAKSGIFPMVKTKEQAAALMLLCQAEGIHPMQALKKYHLVQNRPAMKAEAMLASFMDRGGTVSFVELTDTACSAIFISKGVPDGVTISWDLERAKNAGLLGKDNWAKYPRAMLRSRVVSEGVRAADPGAVLGVYTPEETEDFESAHTQPQSQLVEDKKEPVVVEPPTQEYQVPDSHQPPPSTQDGDKSAPSQEGEAVSKPQESMAHALHGEVVTCLDIPNVPYLSEKPPYNKDGDCRVEVYSKTSGKGNNVWQIKYPGGKTLKDVLKEGYWFKWGKKEGEYDYGWCWIKDMLDRPQADQCANWILDCPCPFNPGVTLRDSKNAMIRIKRVSDDEILWEYPATVATDEAVYEAQTTDLRKEHDAPF